VLPNFDRHNGETAKRRALDARRKEKKRSTESEMSEQKRTNVRKEADKKADQIRGEERRGEENCAPPNSETELERRIRESREKNQP
jgi:hypothetical protein